MNQIYPIYVSYSIFETNPKKKNNPYKSLNWELIIDAYKSKMFMNKISNIVCVLNITWWIFIK